MKIKNCKNRKSTGKLNQKLNLEASQQIPIKRFNTVSKALTLRFLRNFRKLTAKNTTKLGN